GYDGDTTYYLVPVENLPLLDPLRGGPVGNAIADLLQPDLKVLVNLGYGPDNTGYSEYPNVYTPASGLFPDVNPATVLNELVTGAQQGIQNFLTDLKGITPSSILAAMTNGGSTVTPLDLDPSNFITELQTVLTENSNALATLIAGPLDTSTPAVDALTALVLTLPTLNANLVLAGLGQLAGGNLNEALADFTAPIGNNVGLIAGGIGAILLELDTVLNRVEDALQSAATADMDFIAGLPGLLS
ncbi:MAG: PE-PPE domain-containing protein, partial [Mycobacterium sp.]